MADTEATAFASEDRAYFVRERRGHVTPGLPPLANLHSQRWYSLPKIRFAPDSPLEEEEQGFEPPVLVTGPTVRRSSPPARHLVVLSLADVCAPGGALTLLPGFRQRQM